MKLKSILIKNVKSFENLTRIDFDDKLNILVGSNGGGKSNLLDIISLVIRRFLLWSYQVIEEGSSIEIREPLSLEKIDNLLEKFIGDNAESCIKLKIKVDQQDVDNIRIMKKYSKEFENVLNANFKAGFFENFDVFNDSDKFNGFDKFNDFLPKILIDKEITFSIKNNKLENPNDIVAQDYLTYLNSLELCLILAKYIDTIKLNPIYLYFSPYRADKVLDNPINLSSENYYELLLRYLESNSKSNASIIKLASLRFAEKKRSYEYQASLEKEKISLWNHDIEVKKVTEILEKLGFSWKLHIKNKNKNIYEILLTKQNQEFSLSQASSGEKEIINFVLGFFAFNIQGGLLVIDEPELHLHPKWQSVLLDILIDLAEVTNSQLLLSTHSTSFINRNTISNIIRIYKKNNSSNVVTIDKSTLIAAKDLLHIINSYNNEKVFFADKVVLVEGKSDKLIIEKLINHYLSLYDKAEIIEVIEVDGKSNLEKYRKFLEAFCIQNYIIADRDYAQNIGDEKIKNLFIVNSKKVKDEVIDRPDKSLDGQALLQKLDNALSSKNLEDYREELSSLLEYIKSRNRKIKKDLSPDEKRSLNNFIDSQTNEKIYILREGAIENYLPDGFKTLDKIIELVEDEVFHARFLNNELEECFVENRKEIEQIVLTILEVKQPADFQNLNRIREVKIPNKKDNIANILEINLHNKILLLLRNLVGLWRFLEKYKYLFLVIISWIMIVFKIFGIY